MLQTNFDRTMQYYSYLEDTTSGHTLNERIDTTEKIFNRRIEEIRKAEGRQFKWIIVIYVVALFIDSYPGNPALVSAFLMNIAAYNYGKFHFMRDAEASAYKVALEILDKSK